jgi:serine/threonine protein kinase
MPDHIRVVYRSLNPAEEFVAKKVGKRSNELDILRYLDSIERKSDHVIAIVDSFDGWVVLPKLVTIMDHARTARKQIESKIVQVCWGLIEGVAYLHGLCIAHRDIKPDNLLVERDLCLKIIDFDVAMQVEDEDQQVDDRCGTKGWMAPEVEKKSRHSPIRADRWACGRVLLYLLNEFKNEDESLTAFARCLIAYDPKQRPSLIGASSVTLPLFSDVGNVCSAMKRKVLRPSQDPEGESSEPPNTKKQKLHGLGFRPNVVF